MISKHIVVDEDHDDDGLYLACEHDGGDGCTWVHHVPWNSRLVDLAAIAETHEH